eukprot:COSAG04_NODE_1530_length_6451_cov_2.039830_6_plen_76_part_00
MPLLSLPGMAAGAPHRAGRRLRHVLLSLSSAEAYTVTATEAATAEAEAGRLVPADWSAEVIREIMRPEPDGPTEV